MRFWHNGPAYVLIVLFACGCSDGRIKARGRVLKDGSPFVLGEGEGMRIVFAPVNQNDQSYDSYVAVYEKDGSFQVLGKDGKGIRPGKYRVGLEHVKKKEDLFKGAYAANRSGIECDVNSGAQEIVINLDKPTNTDKKKETSTFKRKYR